MSLQWIDYNYLLEHYIKKANEQTIMAAKRVYRKLISKFPTPEDWLNASIEEKTKDSYSHSGVSEYYYILCWLWDKKLYENLSLRNMLLEYLMHPAHNVKKSHVFLAQSQNLLSEEELALINEAGKKRLCLHCILLGKALRDFTDDDVDAIPKLFHKNRYTRKRLQDIRIKLGYTNKIVKRNSQASVWSKLEDAPGLGDIFKDYKDYLIRSDARLKYIQSAVTPLNKLYDYTISSGYTDFSHFTSEDFVTFTKLVLEENSLGTATHYIAKIKKFFQWGTLTDKRFPTDLDFPNKYWTEIIRANKKSKKESDGRAFSTPTLPEDIMKIVYEHKSQNETEYVCRAFWLVAGSCPGRLQFLLDLEADSSLKPLPNEPDTLAIYSRFADKAGNKYGQFPILDKIGINIIQELQERAKTLELKPIQNERNGETYIHLFQLTEKPWILSQNLIYRFFLDKVMPKLKEIHPDLDSIENFKVNVHGFRHHLLTHIAFASGDIEVVQTAAGHKDAKMTKEYLKSKVSKQALLYRVIDKYEQKEITGKFYLRLVELLTTENTDIDEIFTALSSEMTMDEFVLAYGKKMDIGYCFSTAHCSNWLKCWGCTNFMMTKEEINQAINTLARLIINIKNAQKTCVDFTFEHPLINTQIKTISLIVKRLNELGITEEQIVEMFNNLVHKKEITEGVINNAS